MAELKCKYCGKKFISGYSCSLSPTKKHVALTDGTNCVYCGEKFIANYSCSQSPTKKHKLDE